MGWFLLVAKYLILTAIGYLLQPRPRSEDVQPGGVSELGFPTIEDGTTIPVAFGTCWLKNPMVLWYGNLTAAPIYLSGAVIGHRYFVTVHYGLCHGILEPLSGSEEIEVRFDEWHEPDPAVTDNGTFWQLQFNSPTLFGGRETPGEGGVIGRVDVYKGGLSQTSSGHLESLLGPLPGWRGIAYAVFTWTELGNSKNLKPVSFVVKVLPNSLGLTGGAHDISGDANPAAMLYEVLTNRRWGLGVSSGAIDLDNFRDVGDVLKAEGLGLSMIFERGAPARDIQEEILRHIDGVIFTDPDTGLLTLKLARADYTFGDLPILDESMVETCVLRRRAWQDTSNQVRIRYSHRVELTGGMIVERVATAQDLANIQIRNGEVVAEEIVFRGITTAANAARVAARSLKTLAYPLADVELTCNRHAWALRPGSVFRLQWPSLGIVDMVCRVVQRRSGTLTDGRIHIEATEDIWGINWTAYTAPPSTGWLPPVVYAPGWGTTWGQYWGGTG